MDSPLLPTTSRYSNHDTSIESLQLQDLSFGDEDGPEDGGFLAANTTDDDFAPIHQSTSARTSSAANTDQRIYPNNQSDGADGAQDESYEEVTPVKPSTKGKAKAKPRFSLFAVNPAPAPEEEEDHGEEAYPSPPPQQSTRSRNPPQQRQQQDESVRSEEGGSERPLSLSQLGSSSSSSSLNRHQPSSEERDAFLKRALFDLQRINGVFETYIQTVEGVNAYHARVQAQSVTTAKLLQTYISILDSSQSRSTLVSSRTWNGAEADAAAHQAHLASVIAAEQAALRERIEREEAVARERERKAREREDELARQTVKSGMGRGSDGGARGTRGIGRPRGAGAGRGGPPSGIPSAVSGNARGKIPTYSSVKSSGYGPAPKKAL